MYGYCVDEDDIPWIILQHYSNGTLERLLINSNHELSIIQKLEMALDIAKGMSW